MTAALFERGLEAIMGEQKARAVLYGPNCTGAPWASIECSPTIVAGGDVTFRYGDRGEWADRLVRMTAADRRGLEARPEWLRIWLRGERLGAWELFGEGRRRYVLLPGDTLSVHL